MKNDFISLPTGNPANRIFNAGILTKECPRCRDCGYLKDEQNNIIQINGVDQKCPCWLPKAYINSNIGSTYWNVTPDNWAGDKEDLLTISNYFDKLDYFTKTGDGLYLYGEYGVGKTSLIIILLKQIIFNTNHKVFFVPFSDLVILNSKIMVGYHDNNSINAIEYIKNVEFLAIDDLAKEYDTDKDNGRATLNSILRYRDAWGKPTFYTANIPMSQVMSKYGGSNASIIQGRSKLIEMKNRNDYRKRKKIKNELQHLEESNNG